ncbi:MAG TPA: PKD domain-containing protein, partial [Bacteroidia bacterium]
MCCWLSAIGTSNAQVTANFSATPKTGCAPLNVHFTDQSTGGPTSYSWTLPGGNPTTSTQQSPWSSYLVPGVYSVTLTVTNGTSTNTLVQPNYIIVYNPPQANFTMSADTVCVGKTVTFTDATSISPSGAPIGTWLWDFHDGTTLNTSTSPVTHSFSTPGTYPVSVLVTDTNGCGGSQMVKNIVIVPFPTPSFSATPTFACTPPLNVSFTNTSSYIGNTTFFWNFGDGNTSTVKNPTNTYTSSGTFNVTLVINQDGCTDSLRMNNLISIKNIAASFAATPTVICTGQSVAFTNTSVPAASTSNWNFGDGATSTAISPSHTYSTSGTYTVNLSAGDANGCTNNTSGVVLVNQTPLANFSADTTIACSVPFTVNFTNSSTGATNYFWNFGDGSAVSTLPSPSHTYTAIGTYSVSLIATNSGGPCSDTLVKTSYIKIAPPLAFFKHLPDSGCAPLTVNFTDSSSSPLNPVSTYSWSFGDGSTSTAINPSHTYTATGVYSVTLIIHTIGGCVDTFTCSKCIKAGTHPVANYGILKDTVCFGLPVNFSDSSTGATGWNWSFGDGGHSTAQNPIYVYGDTGTYSV